MHYTDVDIDFRILNFLSILNNPLITNDTVYSLLKTKLIYVGLSIILSLASVILYLKKKSIMR